MSSVACLCWKCSYIPTSLLTKQNNWQRTCCEDRGLTDSRECWTPLVANLLRVRPTWCATNYIGLMRRREWCIQTKCNGLSLLACYCSPTSFRTVYISYRCSFSGDTCHLSAENELMVPRHKLSSVRRRAFSVAAPPVGLEFLGRISAWSRCWT